MISEYRNAITFSVMEREKNGKFKIVEQIGAKNDHNGKICDEELRFGTVVKEAMKRKTGYRVEYYQS